jgi:membrane protein DedA with SNARE-associated domain
MKRLLLSIAAGTAFQGAIFLLANALKSPALAIIFLLPGWVPGFAGRDSDHTWSGLIVGWLVMVAVNNLIYATLVYFLLWNRDMRREIRATNADSFIRKPDDDRLEVQDKK